MDEKYIPLFDRLVLELMAVPSRHYPVIKDTGSKQTLQFQAIALIVNSIAFSVSTTLFSHVLVGHPLGTSLLIGMLAGGALWSIDRQTIIDLRLNPLHGRGKAWAVRIGTVTMALMLSLLSAVESHATDIARLQAANTRRNLQASLKEDSIAKTTEFEIDRAKKALTRLDAIKTELTQLNAAATGAAAELKHELEGDYDPRTGHRRIAERGPKARFWQSELDALQEKIKALETEKTSIDNPQGRLADGESKLVDLQKDLGIEQRGVAKKISLLFQLLREEPASWLSVGYGMVLALLPEIMLWRAMARSQCLEADYQELNQLERRRARALVLQMANQLKAEFAGFGQAEVVVTTAHPARAKSAIQECEDLGNGQLVGAAA